jgi:hypothetical protein
MWLALSVPTIVAAEPRQLRAWAEAESAAKRANGSTATATTAETKEDVGRGRKGRMAASAAVYQRATTKAFRSLLPQPGGFEGVVLGRKGLDPHDLSGAQRE